MEGQEKYVINDGSLIADFDGLYKHFKDPWNQSKSETKDSLARIILFFLLEKVKQNISQKGHTVVSLELGCGFGHISNRLKKCGFEAHGIDISTTAVNTAKSLYPGVKFHQGAFNDTHLWRELKVNVFVMSELSWYVLPQIRTFLSDLRSYAKEIGEPVYLVHTLTLYGDKQKFGNEYFTNHSEILTFMNLKTLYSGQYEQCEDNETLMKSFFLAKITVEENDFEYQ